jgi:hypothetical protein
MGNPTWMWRACISTRSNLLLPSSTSGYSSNALKTFRRVTGYVVDLLSDNMSALSWMKITAAMRNPDLQPLARFASALLVQASCLLTRVQPIVEVDALSRLQNGRLRSWEEVICRCSLLRTCKICLLLPALLITLAELRSFKQIVDTYNNVTAHLLTLGYNFLPDGSNLRNLHGSLPPDYVPLK